MTPLLESLQARFAALPALAAGDGELVEARRAAMRAALADGLPGPRTERWKYTPLRAFERRRFDAIEAPTPIDAAMLEAIPAPRMVFVNGRFDASLSSLDGLPDGVVLRSLDAALAAGDRQATALLTRRFERADEVFARLNMALADDGVVVRIEPGTVVEVPLHLVFVGSASGSDAAWASASTIALAADAALCIVEHHLGAGAHSNFANGRVEIGLGERARLAHIRLQHDADGATQILRSDVTLAAAARYQRVDLELGAALSRHELNVTLAGEGAELIANGVQLADGRRHIDTRLGIRHAVGHTSSTMNWRGLGAGRGRAVFHGGIVIDEGADGSAAELSNKNLLLSDEAEIDTQPVLEIFADEVRAAHGATVGQLDPTALFYLRSRGLPVDEAERLLTVAFCREPLAAVDRPELVQLLTSQLDARLGAGDTA